MNDNPGGEPEERRSDRFLEVAVHIGKRLTAKALWAGDACTWAIMIPDRAPRARRRTVRVRAGGALYDGTSGIALFLAELSAVTGCEEFARAALGGLRFAIDPARGLPNNMFGLHSGRVGIAYAAARVALVLDIPQLTADAEAILRPLLGHERYDTRLDVIGGAAGAIPALLWLADRVDAQLATEVAVNLGERLIATAIREPVGWSWRTMTAVVRNLCGYAHGAAGVAHALLELHSVTGDGAYRYAAEQAMLYERAFFRQDLGNWPDLRHVGELSDYLFEGRVEDLRRRLFSGPSFSVPKQRYVTAWCHGAAGIGLSRMRAVQLLGGSTYQDEALAALHNTAASLKEGVNYSLCHGLAGNCELLLVASEQLDEPEWRHLAEQCALRGIERYEDTARSWPCGTWGGVSDPSLLIGEAGIGLFLLRLACPQVPSVLLVTASVRASVANAEASWQGYGRMRRSEVMEFFGMTLRVFRGLGVNVGLLMRPRRIESAPEQSDIAVVFSAIVTYIDSVTDRRRRDYLEDAFRVDRERYELACSVDDLAEEYLGPLLRPSQEEVDWNCARFELSPRVRIVYSRYDWIRWLEGRCDTWPEPSGMFHLVYSREGCASQRRLAPFSALTLRAVVAPATVDEVASSIQAEIRQGGGGPERDTVREHVTAQLQEAYGAGLIRCARGDPLAR